MQSLKLTRRMIIDCEQEGNSLRSEGLTAMLPAFESSRVLTYLDLRNNNIDDAVSACHPLDLFLF
eukprot:3418185-Rhodomonas_salina.5